MYGPKFEKYFWTELYLILEVYNPFFIFCTNWAQKRWSPSEHNIGHEKVTQNKFDCKKSLFLLFYDKAFDQNPRNLLGVIIPEIQIE